MVKNWLDKYKNGGEYLGTTNKGFNYNGAWGGPSMQMGGNIQPPMAGAVQTVPMAQTGDEIKFQEFFKTLPSNLRVDSPDYNLRGYWEALGSPEKFDYSQPKEDDGFYHAFSRNPQTGEILKKPWHPTFKMAIEGDRKAGYYPIVTPEGKVKTVSGRDFQMGGSLPGAPGMMYARTAGAAPSEGPYAKKTLPSAQNGTEEPTSLELAKIKAKMALESHFGNPSARRMTTPYPQDLVFKLNAGPDKGKMGRGTHWMYNEDNYAVPIIQEGADGKLFFNQNASPSDREVMRFNSPEEALMFAENYKRVAPMSRNNFQNGGMAYYQAGLDFKPKTISRDGSVVKDDMGYWNPDNWGKVVEIDSPYITMKGVDQDLIGVSDTGDVQYMTPGNDYAFDGESVTEYPVAKNGVNQQDEKTIEHLDQLLNFTNYNKPKAKSGGWLDKYN